MSKIILSLIALLMVVSSNAQVIEIYKNGVLWDTFTNTPREHYMVKFTEMGSHDKINGHDYVEIGGLKWATMNVGATTVAEQSETAYGDFFAWGETATYYKSYTDGKNVNWKNMEEAKATGTHIVEAKYSHNWINYCGDHNNKDNKFYEWDPKPYDDNYVLLGEYDVAEKKWGSSWRMPTVEEFRSLINACGGASDNFKPKTVPDDGLITVGGIYWVPATITIDGFPYNVAGVLFVATEDTHQRVFFPAAGNIQNTDRSSAGTLCSYWTSTRNKTADLTTAYTFYINEKEIIRNSILSRCKGFTVRPVSN